ncbi:hypothetical protein PENSPDRAFT_749642 [Peniophora sp. CONT]|nr:hypothetical protein PENSPDRAFT_749642 [Peniophora sp. CONT]
MLLAFPHEVLEQIALELAVHDAVGPPKDLPALLLTCKELYARLGLKHNKHLYFRIYACQFDTTAHRRRFGDRAHNSGVVARQLVRAWIALGRLRLGDLDASTLHDDLWEAFCLVTENDGKNAYQLQWAGMPALSERYVREKLWENTVNGWPRDTPTSALALWLLWSTMDDARLRAYTEDQRQEIIDLILPFVVVGFKYTNFYAPDVTYVLPLTPGVEPNLLVSQINAHGPYPVFRSVEEEPYRTNRFDTNLHIVMPPLVSAAKMLYFALRETVPIQVPDFLPVDRAEALTRGQTRGQTQADLHEVNAYRSTPFIPLGIWNFLETLSSSQRGRELEGVRSGGLLAPSAAWDDDWERFMTCWNPWSQPYYKGPVYSPGSLTGLWQGRLLVPDVGGYLNLVTTAQRPEEFGESAPFMSTWPAFMRLSEQHAVSPMPKVPVPVNRDDALDHGIWNAWMPPRCRFSHERGSVTVIDDSDGSRYVHETYVEGQPNSHDPDTCTMCNRALAEDNDEEESQSAISEDETSSESESEELASEGEAPQYTHADFEQEFADAGLGHGDEDQENDSLTPVSSCSGVVDIIITGETDENHGLAWGHFTIFGRVRTWDGLVALVRAPAEPGRPRWVFRGYLHYGQAFVGAWRGMTNIQGQARAVPWEGPFVLNRRAEPTASA